MQWIGDDFTDGSIGALPIRVDGLIPARTGQRRFGLRFYHANYPEGVRDKTYSLLTIERSVRFMLARRMEKGVQNVQYLFIHDVTWPWLKRHFGVGPVGDAPEDIEDWLRRNT